MPSLTIRLSERVVRDCIADIDEHFPLESGGIFIGYWDSSEVAVVTAMIPGGPNARRSARAFEADAEWQTKRIADVYAASGRRETYLGDWHSHPNTKVAALSWDDKAVMRKIICSPAARTPRLLMFIFAGSLENWRLWGWLGEMEPRRILPDRLTLSSANIDLV